MTESIVTFLLPFHLLNRQLQLALDLPHEEVVDDDVVSRAIQFVLDPDQFELALHALTILIVQSIHSLQEVDEATFTALIFRPQQITDVESNKVKILIR